MLAASHSKELFVMTNISPFRSTRLTLRVLVPLTVGAVALSACGSADTSDESTTPEATAASTQDPADSESGAALSVTDPWVSTAEDGMTAAYGVLANDTDAEITITGASSEVSSDLELHETVMDASGAMVMQELEGGMVIPAGESRTLEPGGDHVMFMDLNAPILAGEEIEVVLQLEDGSSVPMLASAREHAGGEENYVGGGHGDMDDHGASTHDPGDHDTHGEMSEHTHEGGHGEHTTAPDEG